MTLYEIDAEYVKALEECLDTETGEVIDLDRLKEVQDKYCEDRQAKIDNLICYIKSRKALAESIKAEKQNLAHRQSVLENQIGRLEQYLQLNLDGQTYESAKGKITYRKSESVEIDMLYFLDNADAEDFLDYAEPKPRKADIKKAIKEGRQFDGAILVTKTNMQIK